MAGLRSKMSQQKKDWLNDKHSRPGYIPVLVLFLVFALSALALFANYFKTKKELEKEFTQEKLVDVRYTAREIEDFLTHEQVALTNVAGLLSMTGNLDKGRIVLDLFLKSHKRSPRQFSFLLLDPRGRYLYSVPEPLDDRYMQDLSMEGYFSETVKQGGHSYSGILTGKRGEDNITLSVPVRKDGGLLGVLVEKVSVKALEQTYVNQLAASENGSAFLLAGKGVVLARQGPEAGKGFDASGLFKNIPQGKEGFALTDSPYTGKPVLKFFSPLEFGGVNFTVGLALPADQLYDDARSNLESTLLIISLMTLAFSWALISVTRSSRYKASMEERTRLSNYLMLRNRELTALNDLSREIGGVEELGVMLSKAIDIIVENTGANGAAVRLISDGWGGLELKAQKGMPAGFADRSVCTDVAQCLCGRVLSEGRTVRFKDPVSEQGTCMASWEGEAALVPLTTRNRPLGILYLCGHWEWESTEEMENFLMAYGNQLSSNIENMLQMEDTKRYAARAGALFQTAQALTRSLDLDDLLGIIMKEAAALLKVKRSLLMLYSEEDNLINCRVALGFSDSPAGSLSFSPSGVFWEAMEDGGVKVVDLRHAKVDVPRKFSDDIGIQEFILVPLMSKGKVLGFIVLEPEKMGGIPMEDLKMVVGFASQAAVAIETSSFYMRTVERYNYDLQQLSSRIMSAQEEERKRISRDLHDELGQVLTATKISLDMIHAGVPPSLEQLKLGIGDAIGLVVSALDSVRRLSFDLRPSMLDDLGLLMAAGKLVSDFKKRSGIDVDFNTEGMEDRLDTKVEVALYRVIQEALTNILKHSGAGKAVINLKQDLEKGTVSLFIEDDGIGFSPHAEPQDREPKGFGLMGIRERVSLLGGNFRIFSEEGEGTKLFIDIPCLKGDGESWKIL